MTSNQGRSVGAMSSDEQFLGDVLDFMRTLWAVDHGLRSMSKEMRLTLGVTGPQRLALRMLGQFPNLKAGELATLLHLDPSTLTGVLRRLEGRRLLSRRTDPEDARSARLRLTARGMAMAPARQGTVENSVRHALARLPAWKVTAAKEVLKSLAEELNHSIAHRKGKK
jgi:DNA-binding MarR family transcriptional regulator